MRRRAASAVLLVVGVALGAAPPAAASCAVPPSLEESLSSAELAFVGTVVELNNLNRWATFQVEEVWKGEPGTTRLDVRGGPPGGAATSVDRTFELDTRYLVFASRGERHWEDNTCSATQPYDQSLAALRPSGARTVTTLTGPANRDGGTSSGTVVFAGVVLLLMVGGVVIVRRLGSKTRS